MVKTEKLIFEKIEAFTRHKNGFVNAVKLLIAAGLLIFIINKININEVLFAVKTANIYLLSAAFFLTFINIFLQFWKWKLSCNTLLDEKNKKKILVSLFYGFSAGAFTPVRIGEYFGRGIAFKDKSLIKVTVATIIDKFFPLMAVTFFGAVSSLLFIYYYYHVTLYITISLFVVLFLLFYFLVMLILNPDFWDNMLFNKLKKSKKLNYFLARLSILQNLDKNFSSKMWFISILFYFCYILQYAILVSAFSHHYSFLNYIWAGNLIMFAKTVIPPVSLGELGIREGASVFFIMQMGEISAVGFNASIFLFLINILLPSFVGLLLLAKRNND